MCNCHGHCDTLWCVVCITSVCLGNEKGCPLPALWLASKCGLRRCGEREKYRVCGNVRGFFFLIFLFKTLRKIRILNNTQDQMKQLSQKKNYFNSERLPLHFRTGIWGTCVLPTAGILSSHQIFLQETSSLEELRCCQMGVRCLAMPWQILPAPWGNGSQWISTSLEALRQYFQSKHFDFQCNTCQKYFVFLAFSEVCGKNIFVF